MQIQKIKEVITGLIAEQGSGFVTAAVCVEALQKASPEETFDVNEIQKILDGLLSEGKGDFKKDKTDEKKDEKKDERKKDANEDSDFDEDGDKGKPKGGGFEKDNEKKDGEGEKKDDDLNSKKKKSDGDGRSKKILSTVLNKRNHLGLNTTAVYSTDALALSVTSPTRPYTIFVDAIISIIEDLTITRINIHPSVIINDILSPSVSSVIATGGSKIITNYVKVMSQVAGAGRNGEKRPNVLAFISEALMSNTDIGSHSFTADQILDALQVAAVLRPFRGTSPDDDWITPAQEIEQNIPHKLFADASNFTDVLGLANALDNTQDLLSEIDYLVDDSNYESLRNSIIQTISDLNAMSSMTIMAKGMLSVIADPQLIARASAFARRDFAKETATGLFSLSAWDLLIICHNSGYLPSSVSSFLDAIIADGFVNSGKDCPVFQNGLDIDENFRSHPTSTVWFDFTAIKRYFEPEGNLQMEQLLYRSMLTVFENDPSFSKSIGATSPSIVTDGTSTVTWFDDIANIYRYMNVFHNVYVNDCRSDKYTNNPLDKLVDRHRTTDPMTQNILDSLLKMLSTCEYSRRNWASICKTFVTLICDEGRYFTEDDDWPLTVDKRRAVKMSLDYFNSYLVPVHFKRYSFNPLINDQTLYVFRTPVKTNWERSSSRLTTLGKRDDLIWILRPDFVELMRKTGYYLLASKIDRPVTDNDIVRIHSHFTIDTLDSAYLANSNNSGHDQLYDVYSLEDVNNRQLIASLANVMVGLDHNPELPNKSTHSLQLDPAIMFSNVVTMDQLLNISQVLMTCSTMSSDIHSKQLYILESIDPAVQNLFASHLGGLVSTLNKPIDRSGVLSLPRMTVPDMSSAHWRCVMGKFKCVQTPVYRHTVSDQLRASNFNTGANLFPLEVNNRHLLAITDIFMPLLRQTHPNDKSFTREILMKMGLPRDVSPQAVFIDISARHLFTPASFASALAMDDLVVAQPIVIETDSITSLYNHDIYSNEPLESELNLWPIVIDIDVDASSDVLLDNLFKSESLLRTLNGAAAYKEVGSIFHLEFSNRQRIIYRATPLNNIFKG